MVHVIPPPVFDEDIRTLAAQPTGIDWIANRQDGSDPQIILSVCRLVSGKDIPTLLHAYDLVRQDFPNSKLVIVGEGKQKTKIEEIITELDLKENVFLTGYTDNPFAYMNKSSVFVSTSKREGFGKTLAEAMYLGVPVISSDCPVTPREIVSNQAEGQLFPTGDIEAAAACIKSALLTEKERGTSKVSVPDMVKYGAEATTQKLLALCQQTMQQDFLQYAPFSKQH